MGMVSVCPGGHLLLTCDRISGSILYWDVSVPRMPSATIQRIVLSQGDLASPEFKIGFTEFNIIHTSDNPLISQLLINNVTTEINGSNIYCSEDGDETNAPLTVINVKYKGIILIMDNGLLKIIFHNTLDEFWGSVDHSLNVTMVNQLLRSDDVTVTLQWPREPGAVYHINILPEPPHNELNSMMYNIFMISLTISYDIQYNISIVSSLCGVTTTKVLNYGKCIVLACMALGDHNIIIDRFTDSVN